MEILEHIVRGYADVVLLASVLAAIVAVPIAIIVIGKLIADTMRNNK